MTTLSYDDLVNTLFPRLTGGIRWGLERTRVLLERVGNPHDRMRTIHVGGTNGKGSVAATIANGLQAAGLRTGLYTSPHLCSFRERIRIDGEPISEAALLAAAAPLLAAIEDLGASFFEATTAIGFHALATGGVDVAVVEVGLGGRLDSTNVITPELSIITNIAFDHADYLGNTLASIATEKAGIIKPGVPLLTAEEQPELRSIFERTAARQNAPVITVPAHEVLAVQLDGTRIRLPTAHWGTIELSTPLIGRHQAQNTALAAAALDLLADRYALTAAAVKQGTATVAWPGRMQVVRRQEQTWVFDVAHNEAGVAALAATFAELPLPRPVSLLVGILGDKDWGRMLPRLFDLADHITLTVPPSAPPNRAWNPADVLERVPHARARVESDFAAALSRAAASAGARGTILVTGSFHTVGDALALLGLCPTVPDFALPHNDFSR